MYFQYVCEEAEADREMSREMSADIVQWGKEVIAQRHFLITVLQS